MVAGAGQPVLVTPKPVYLQLAIQVDSQVRVLGVKFYSCDCGKVMATSQP